MPVEASSSSAPSKPATRSSFRLSFNLAGKAIADVMNKESDKAAKKGAKETGSRRLSVVNAKPTAPRASMGDGTRPPSTSSRRTVTPDSKTVTRRRVSAAAGRQSLDEQPAKPTEATPQGAAVTRSASLRPRPGVSALPKYRPKSMLGEPAKPPSPARAGVRRRLSVSDDEKEDEAAQQPTTVESAAEKSLRPISPLPQRAAFKVNLTSVINAASPPVAPSKARPAPSSSSKAKPSPARPTKTVKTTASSNPTVPRPSSSASSSSSFTPRTPKSPPNGKAAAGVRRPDKGPSNQSSPLRDSPQRSHSESPLARHSRKGSHLSAPADANEVGNMSHISEGNSEDSEAEHVELLLAPVAELGAPTPAMPRMVKSRNRPRGAAPRTPTRSQLPSRANLSYLSPLPPDSDSPPSLRPQQAGGTGASAGRGSILSWEQLATEASRTLGEDEIASMLSEMPAPFRAGAISPNQYLEIPESPALSALNSPGEYGSISQVLLPDVTPSPAVHANTSRYNARDGDVPAVDAAIVTLLRLQLVSAESIAKERLLQLQGMEEEIHNLKQARARDAEALAEQMGHLEDQLRGSLEMRERAEEDRTARIARLEDQLRQADVSHDQTIGDVVAQTRESAQAEAEVALKLQNAKTSAVWSARVAGTHWAFVRDFAESELDVIQGDREVLAALLADLD
ncbi:hypothetical protein DFH07DRAFT_686369, partial [Mycena maculata]